MKLLAQIDFNDLNQKIFPGTSPFAGGITTSLGLIVSELLKYLFPLAGILLFFYLILAGFSYLTSGGEPKAMEKAKDKITHAVIGFVILFAAFWLVQIFDYIFGLTGTSFTP